MTAATCFEHHSPSWHHHNVTFLGAFNTILWFCDNFRSIHHPHIIFVVTFSGAGTTTTGGGRTRRRKLPVSGAEHQTSAFECQVPKYVLQCQTMQYGLMLQCRAPNQCIRVPSADIFGAVPNYPVHFDAAVQSTKPVHCAAVPTSTFECQVVGILVLGRAHSKIVVQQFNVSVLQHIVIFWPALHHHTIQCKWLPTAAESSKSMQSVECCSQ